MERAPPWEIEKWTRSGPGGQQQPQYQLKQCPQHCPFHYCHRFPSYLGPIQHYAAARHSKLDLRRSGRVSDSGPSALLLGNAGAWAGLSYGDGDDHGGDDRIRRRPVRGSLGL